MSLTTSTYINGSCKTAKVLIQFNPYFTWSSNQTLPTPSNRAYYRWNLYMAQNRDLIKIYNFHL